MPIYRCNKCAFVSEDTQTPINTQAACGRCGNPSTVYGTVYYVEELVKRLAATARELQALKAAAAPTETSVIAKPMLKHSTSAAPSVNSFTWMQSSKTVMAAGQGIRPPVRPNRIICPVVTLRFAKRFLMSFACAFS